MNVGNGNSPTFLYNCAMKSIFVLVASCVLPITVFSVFWPAEAQTGKDPKAPPAKLAPVDAAKSFKVPEDLRFDQVLAEPTVKQPLSLSFDERGRLWVVQYIQYPHPAGLKVVSRDIFWRVVYDKAPPAAATRC